MMMITVMMIGDCRFSEGVSTKQPNIGLAVEFSIPVLRGGLAWGFMSAAIVCLSVALTMAGSI
jgi:hypothetical protein